ncbi:hypothetical protein D3C80_1412920 [compost metagenome]
MKPGTGSAVTAVEALSTADAADCASTVCVTAPAASLAAEIASPALGGAGIRNILFGSFKILGSLSIPSSSHL